ncbi:ArsC family reductase [Spongorhabdus nitratireducens]
MITLYGIPNCDTMKKARRWLDANGIEYHFHNYKKDGIDSATLQNWCDALGWETVLNRRGTTWRRLPEADRESIDEASAIRLMQENTSLIKRPILDAAGKLSAGFSDADYTTTLL